MAINTLRIATRQSPLAVWQAEFVKQQLMALHPQLHVELIKISTQGDNNQSQALATIGGKSLFVKELQKALLDNKADIAVHYIKDMSVHDHPQLSLGAILKRANASDAFVSNNVRALDELKHDAIIGTASPRRQALIKSLYPSFTIKLMRGNVNTRLSKLDHGDYDAIILAAAGLERLGLANRISSYLPKNIFIPAIGQGALGIECRSQDSDIRALIKPLHHELTATCVDAERIVNRQLGGSCFTPIGAHATIDNDVLILQAFVGSVDGQQLLRSHQQGPVSDAKSIGLAVANDLIQQGALALIHHET